MNIITNKCMNVVCRISLRVLLIMLLASSVSMAAPIVDIGDNVTPINVQKNIAPDIRGLSRPLSVAPKTDWELLSIPDEFRLGELTAPVIDENGLVYVGENDHSNRDIRGRVLVISTKGQLIRTIGEDVFSAKLGPNSGRKNAITTLAIDKSNRLLYALTAEVNRVSVFTLKGKHVGSIQLPSELISPNNSDIRVFDFDVDAKGRLLFPDYDHNCIRIYNPSNKEWQAIGEASEGRSRLKSPVAVSVSPDGSIYVVDAGNYRVVRFSKGWKYLYEIRRSESAEQDYMPGDVSATADGGVVVGYLNQIAAFNKTGRLTWEWRSPRDGQELVALLLGGVDRLQAERRGGITSSPDGSVYISNEWDADYIAYHTLTRLSRRSVAQGLETMQIATKSEFGGAGYSQFNHPCGVAIDSKNSIFIGEFNNHRVQKFDSNGNYQLKFGVDRVKSYGEWLYGERKDDLQWPAGIAIDDARSVVYVADWAHGRIRQYSVEGSLIRDFGEGSKPWGIAVDSRGYIYVSDPLLKGVRVFNPEGEQEFTLGPEQGITFLHPGMLAVHGQKIYVTDRESNEVIVLDIEARTETMRFGKDTLLHPDGIAVGRDGDIWVADTSHHRIARFESDGKLKSVSGSQGIKPGQFNWPKGVCVDNQDRIIVTDWGNNRVQVFTPESLVKPMLVWGNYSTQNAMNGLRISTVRPYDNDLLVGEGIVSRSGNIIRTLGQQRHEYTWGARTDFPWVLDAVRIKSTILTLESLPVEHDTVFRVYSSDGGLLREFSSPIKRLSWAEDLPKGLTSNDTTPRIVLQGNRLLVTDPFKKQILIFGIDGQVKGSFGKGVIGMPGSIALGGRSRIYVTDTLKHKVLVFGADGKLLHTFGSPGVHPQNILFPTGITIAPDGSVLVLDRGNQRVKRFDAKGRILSISPLLESEFLNFISTGHGGRIYLTTEYRLWTLMQKGK